MLCIVRHEYELACYKIKLDCIVHWIVPSDFDILTLNNSWEEMITS